VSTLSVIVVSWNTRSLLVASLRSVFASAPPGLREVIVVDNGSRDGTPEAVRREFPEATLVENPENLGYARAINQGLERARGEYVLLLNSDTVLPARALEPAVEFARRARDAAAVGCRIAYPGGRFQPSAFRFPNLFGLAMAAAGLPRLFPRSPLLNWDGYGGRDWSRVQEVEFVTGCFLLLRAEALREVGPLDTRFFLYGEEADLCMRLRRKGWKVLYSPDPTVVHLGGGSATDAGVRAWTHEAKQRAILFFLHKWRGPLVAWIGNAILLLGSIPRLLVWLPADILDRLRAPGRPAWERVRKLRTLPFHLRAVWAPRSLRRSWERL
jgi:hypothetical protein